MECEVVDKIHVAQGWAQWRSREPTSSIQGG